VSRLLIPFAPPPNTTPEQIDADLDGMIARIAENFREGKQ
jgi:hypothetical protein